MKKKQLPTLHHNDLLSLSALSLKFQILCNNNITQQMVMGVDSKNLGVGRTGPDLDNKRLSFIRPR